MNGPVLYGKGNSYQRRNVASLCDEFEDELSKISGPCLDIGSGPGDAAVDFILPKLKKGVNFVCSDVSEKMVNFGRDMYKDNHRISFIKLDIESANLPIELVEQFDHITSFHCLHWCQNVRQAIRNIFDLLRPGGRGLLSLVTSSPIYDTWEALAAMPQYELYMKDAKRHIPIFQHSESPRKAMRTIIEDTGFEVRHCSVREMNQTFRSAETISNFALGIDPFVDHIPSDLTEEYKKDLIEDYGRRNFTSNMTDDYTALGMNDIFVSYLRKPMNSRYLKKPE